MFKQFLAIGAISLISNAVSADIGDRETIAWTAKATG